VEFAGTAEINGCTVILIGTVTINDFFRALTKTVTPSGETFLLDSKEVKFFPEVFAVRVIVSSPISLRKHGCVALSDDVMDLLSFDGQWKRGTEMRPVKSLVLKDHPRSIKNGTTIGWVYTLVCQDQAIPLSDHLILSVTIPNSNRRIQMSLQL